jgi:hypothetical protein
VRALSLIEGRIVEAMLGVRMPRRPPYPTQGLSLMKRIGALFTDGHTWTTLFYMIMMLPLGIIYFTITITLLATSVAFIGAPIAYWTDSLGFDLHFDDARFAGPWSIVVLFVLGILLLFGTMHLVRALGRMHGHIAKHLLVPRSSY